MKNIKRTKKTEKGLGRKRGKPGFTLIELLVVISIMGLLASIMVTTIHNSELDARDVSIKQGTTALVQAFNQYYEEHGSVPTPTDMAPLNGTYYSYAGGTDEPDEWSYFNFLVPNYVSALPGLLNKYASYDYYYQVIPSNFNTANGGPGINMGCGSHQDGSSGPCYCLLPGSALIIAELNNSKNIDSTSDLTSYGWNDQGYWKLAGNYHLFATVAEYNAKRNTSVCK